MNAKYFLGALAFSVLLIASCGKKTGGCYKGEKAWVKDFSESDRLRDEIAALGWIVQDSKDGQKLLKR